MMLPSTAGPAIPVTAAIVRSIDTSEHHSAVHPIRFEQFRLANGLRVLLAPDHSAPVVAVNVTYDVGSRHEVRGKTGIAHLLEHLMFQGSENVGKGEHNLLVSSVGGVTNASTTTDRTAYFETLPANQLKMALFLEGDRMRSLDLTQANLDNQRLVVEEERAQTLGNRGFGGMMQALTSLAYTKFGYQHPVMGSVEDLDMLTLSDLRSFYTTYYAPNNAVLTIAGDFDPTTARGLIDRYFAGIPARPIPPAVDATEPIRSNSDERRTVLTDARARQTQVLFGFLTVAGNDPDYYPLRLLAALLSSGPSERSARGPGGFEASLPETRDAALFTIAVFVRPDSPGATPVDRAEAALDREIERIASGGISANDLAYAQTRERVALATRYATDQSRASALSLYSVLFDDPDRINTLGPDIDAITIARIKEVARKYLTKSNRSVVIVEPPASEVFPK